MKRHAVIVAAGRGERAGGGLAKQLRPLGGHTVLDWSVDAFSQAGFDTVMIVCPPDEVAEYRQRFALADHIAEGGNTRAASVRAGLQALEQLEGSAPDDAVFIHDAARPGLKKDVLTRLTKALGTADGAAPALPMVDAIKQKHGASMRTVDRSALFRVQTPQVFRLGAIVAATQSPGDYVDDLEAMEASGANIALVDGDERLAKLTYPDDFTRLERLLMPTPLPRMGTGFDVHAFEPGDHVTLCGIDIPHDAKLAGHSDADVGWHALTDAILGAVGAGDIGDHFPPSDPQWKGAPSKVFLQHAVKLAEDAGYKIGNCDLTIVCEAPKIKPHREAMRAMTADIMALDKSQVSIKATTTEGLGFTGRREGIAAQAAVLLSPMARQD